VARRNPLDMTTAERITALRSFEAESQYYDAVCNGRARKNASEEVARTNYLKALKIVLTLVLGREPSEEEIAAASDP
jgi:hypothetical protein